MDEELYVEIKEKLTEELGREPTEYEISEEFACACDHTYETYRDDYLNYNGD